MIPEQDRDLNHLHRIFRQRLEGWLSALRLLGRVPLIYETFRTPARQVYLYGQGRTRPGPIVTYTLDSLHRYGAACDLMPVENGTATWDQAAYDRLYRAVSLERFGLENLDFERPHVQLVGGLATCRQLGIAQDVLVGSVWPPPAPKPVVVPALPPKPAPALPPAAPLVRVTLVDMAGQDVQLLDEKVIFGGVLVERGEKDVRLTRASQLTGEV